MLKSELAYLEWRLPFGKAEQEVHDERQPGIDVFVRMPHTEVGEQHRQEEVPCCEKSTRLVAKGIFHSCRRVVRLKIKFTTAHQDMGHRRVDGT